MNPEVVIQGFSAAQVKFKLCHNDKMDPQQRVGGVGLGEVKGVFRGQEGSAGPLWSASQHQVMWDAQWHFAEAFRDKTAMARCREGLYLPPSLLLGAVPSAPQSPGKRNAWPQLAALQGARQGVSSGAMLLFHRGWLLGEFSEEKSDLFPPRAPDRSLVGKWAYFPLMRNAVLYTGWSFHCGKNLSSVARFLF